MARIWLWGACKQVQSQPRYFLAQRYKSLEDSENLPDPGILAQEIVEDLEAALGQFRLIAEDLGEGKAV